MSNSKVMRFLDLPHPNVEHSKKYIESIILQNSENPRMIWKMAVFLNDTKVFIGMVCLEPETTYIKEGRAEISYYFMPEYWGKGYASEASKAMIKFGFEILGLNKITSGCLKINTSSESVMIACNMKKEAEYKKHTKFEDEWVNRIEYAILRDEYVSI